MTIININFKVQNVKLLVIKSFPFSCDEFNDVRLKYKLHI
jgi:hypothetical protein